MASTTSLLDRLSRALSAPLKSRYDALAAAAVQGLDGTAMAARALRNACLAWLTRLDPEARLAQAQFDAGGSMTERIAALRCLLHFQAPGAAAALQAFRDAHAQDPLVTDKWIALLATRPDPEALDDVQALMATPWWKPANPNRVRAVLGNFQRGNPRAFHRADLIPPDREKFLHPAAGRDVPAFSCAALDSMQPAFIPVA